MGRGAHIGIAWGVACAIALCGGTAAMADIGDADAAATPAKAAISSVKAGAGSVTVKVKKCRGAKGYQYQVARNSAFTKSAKSARTSKMSCTLSGLSQGAKWYARARGYSGKRYGKWSAFRSVKTRKARKAKPVARYRYRIRFLYQPMAYDRDVTPSGWPCYIETDNPDPRKFKIADSYLDKKRFCYGDMDFRNDDSGDYDDLAGYERVDITDTSEPWYDPDNVSTHFHAVKVPGGYAGYMRFTRPGTYSVKVTEDTGRGKATVSVGTVTAENADECDDRAIDRIVDRVCDKSLPKGDQMQQIADYIRAHSYYGPQGLGAHLFVNLDYSNSNLETYAAGGMCVLNSSGSGALLAQIGKHIGYPLKSLYWTDENGDDYPSINYYDLSKAPEWAAKHAKAYSKADDRYFSCCPYEYTGKAYIATLRDSNGKIPPFDFRGYGKYVDVR